MTSVVQRTEVNQAKALDWLRYAPRQGVISPAALRYVVVHRGHFYTLAPDAADPAQLADFEHGLVGPVPAQPFGFLPPC